MKNSIFKTILFSIVPVLIVAGLGSLFVNLGMDWFNSLIKPTQWIPSFIIPIVWSVIYLISAIILFNWAQEDIPKKVWILFLINGIFNILWCLIFFSLNQTFLGLIIIVLNLILGYVLLLNIKPYKIKYFYWLSIYPVWLSVATCLNLASWILN